MKDNKWLKCVASESSLWVTVCERGGEGCKTCRLFLCGPNTSLTPHSLSSMMHRATETMRKGLKSFIAAIQGSRRFCNTENWPICVHCFEFVHIPLNNIHMWDVQRHSAQWRRSFWAGETKPAIVERKKGRVEAGLHKLWYPIIRDTSTWSKFGAHGELEMFSCSPT